MILTGWLQFDRHLSKTMLLLALLISLNSQTMAGNAYRVKTGDTIEAIARQYNVSSQKLIEINNLKSPNDIRPGNLLRLSDTKAIYYQGKTQSYTVQSGDTLSSIAKKFDTNIATLAELNDELNDENFDRLQSGLKITVPAALVATIPENRKFDFFKTTPRAVTPTVSTSTSADKIFSYTVKPGETLSGIAQKFKVSLKDLAAMNALTTQSMLVKGQKLDIPADAERFAILLDTPKPTATKTAPPSTKTVETPKNANNDKDSDFRVDFITYKVKAGESLSVLARRYNTTTAGLARINGLAADAGLNFGQSLLVPITK